MAEKHTGSKILQQDTIDAIDKMITQQVSNTTEIKLIKEKLAELEDQQKLMNVYLSMIVGEKIKEDEIE